MTAPAPSPAEQAEIDRFGIFEAEEILERAAMALFHAEDAAADWSYFSDEFKAPYRRLAAAAVVARFEAADYPSEVVAAQVVFDVVASAARRGQYRAACERCAGHGWTGPEDPRPGATCDDCNGTGDR